MGTIDLLPTFAAITDTPLPSDLKIDGINSLDLLTGKSYFTVREEFIYYTSRGEAEGIRQGNWKLLKKKKRGKAETELLFNLKEDMGEKNNLYKEYPKIVSRLNKRLSVLDKEIEENSRSPWFQNGR
jgi:arylsulfatase A-like enzyme